MENRLYKVNTALMSTCTLAHIILALTVCISLARFSSTSLSKPSHGLCDQREDECDPEKQRWCKQQIGEDLGIAHPCQPGLWADAQA